MSDSPLSTTQEAKIYRSHGENVDWFEALPRIDKEMLQAETIRRCWIFEYHLQCARTNIWNTDFSKHWLFKMLMELMDRSQPSIGMPKSWYKQIGF